MTCTWERIDRVCLQLPVSAQRRTASLGRGRGCCARGGPGATRAAARRYAAVAQANPDETFSIAEAVLLAELRADYPHVPVEDVKRFLAHILKAGNSDTQARARRLINRLGERGYRQLKDLLDENGGASG